MAKKTSSGQFEYIITKSGEGMICGISCGTSDTLVVPDEIDGVKITSIAYPFPAYRNIKHIIISDGIAKIPDGFLKNNCYIESVRWPSSCPVIPSLCFHSCSSLEKIENLDNVRVIGGEAFAYSSITMLDLHDTCIKTINKKAFRGSCISNISWPKECICIPEKCFFDSALESISGIEGVKYIGCYAFNNSNLSGELDLSNTNIEEIEEGAFYNCHALDRVVWPAQCTDIPSSCFYSTRLTSIANINKVEFIGEYAFAYTGISRLDLSKTEVEYVGGWAFFSCTALKEVIWNKSCTVIPSFCFASCDALHSINNVESVKTIQSSAFEGCGFVSLNLQKSFPNVEYIGKGAFQKSFLLKSIVWPPSVPIVNDDMFCECNMLSTIENLNTVLEIGPNAFACTSLDSVDLSSSLIGKIDQTSFEGCNLKNFVPPYYVDCGSDNQEG